MDNLIKPNKGKDQKMTAKNVSTDGNCKIF